MAKINVYAKRNNEISFCMSFRTETMAMYYRDTFYKFCEENGYKDIEVFFVESEV